MTAAPSAALVRVLALLCGWAVTDVAHAADDPPPTDATWQDPLRELRLAARGSLGVCELLTLPVAWIPGVGDAASIVVELACIVPAVVAVDHVAVLHTHRNGTPMDAAAALLLKKSFEVGVALPVFVVGTWAGTQLGDAAYAATARFGVPYPVALAMGLSGGIVSYVALTLGSTFVGEWIFTGSYWLLTRELRPDEALTRAPPLVASPLPPGVAHYALVATVAGARPRFSLTHWLPIVGPLVRAEDAHQDMRMRLRRFANDDLHQSPDLARADAIDTVMTTAGGGLQAVGHTALLSGLALMGGAVGQWWLYRQDARLAEGLAWAGLWSAAAGGVLLGAGQVTWLSRGLVLPIAFWAAEPAAESVAAE